MGLTTSLLAGPASPWVPAVFGVSAFPVLLPAGFLGGFDALLQWCLGSVGPTPSGLVLSALDLGFLHEAFACFRCVSCLSAYVSVRVHLLLVCGFRLYLLFWWLVFVYPQCLFCSNWSWGLENSPVLSSA